MKQMTISKTDYKNDLIQRFWQYQESKFPQLHTYFEQRNVGSSRPPVFLAHAAWKNIIVNPNANQEEIEQLYSLMPESEHHRWFHSMNSSQALALSILGNLLIYNSLDILGEAQDDQGKAIFGRAKITPDNFVLEHKVDYLGEPRPTSLDGYISGDYKIAIECKFTENEFGSCSRPRLTPKDSNYSRDYCDGTYSKQNSRITRCSLSEIGVRYWNYVSKLFEWESNRDLVPCPLYKNYQLVRNILAVGVDSNKQVSSENGHAVTIYDERNPAFQEGGDGYWEYLATKDALRNPGMLRKCSWQSITQLIRKKGNMHWLTDELEFKYGF